MGPIERTVLQAEISPTTHQYYHQDFCWKQKADKQQPVCVPIERPMFQIALPFKDQDSAVLVHKQIKDLL